MSATIMSSANVLRAVSVAAIMLALAGVAGAQAPDIRNAQPSQHTLLPAGLPPGMAGAARLIRGGPLVGWFQPVQFLAEPGVGIAVAADGTFTEPVATPTTVGLLVGPVYRFRVTNIPGYEGREVFPTVELVDRLYPPAGAETRFAIPIELTPEDLHLALAGHFITRVVYLEDPQQALPNQGNPQHTSWFDAGPGADPLVEADERGRPVAIVRLGGRLPDDRDGADMQFLFGCPPLKLFHPPALPAYVDRSRESADGAEGAQR
ncbi:MAG TPA: hypothetical protein VG713_07615 [Pirellulales bacterium]|nr:hypothetical protein [Pirellulales bacterium]